MVIPAMTISGNPTISQVEKSLDNWNLASAKSWSAHQQDHFEARVVDGVEDAALGFLGDQIPELHGSQEGHDEYGNVFLAELADDPENIHGVVGAGRP